MAKSCVDLTENEYTLHKPLWVKEEIGVGETALCVRTPENVLRKGERIYKDRRFTKGTLAWEAVGDLIAALKASSWTSNHGLIRLWLSFRSQAPMSTFQ